MFRFCDAARRKLIKITLKTIKRFRIFPKSFDENLAIKVLNSIVDSLPNKVFFLVFWAKF
jgi:hypothetical protein